MALEKLKSIFSGIKSIIPRSIHTGPNNFHIESHSIFDNLIQPNFTKLKLALLKPSIILPLK